MESLVLCVLCHAPCSMSQSGSGGGAPPGARLHTGDAGWEENAFLKSKTKHSIHSSPGNVRRDFFPRAIKDLLAKAVLWDVAGETAH